MDGTNWRILLILVVSWSLACSENEPSDSAQENTPLVEKTLLKGHAIFGHEVRSIRPCNQDEAIWAIDSTQLLYEIHGELAPGVEPYEEVFVVVEGHDGETLADGFGADYPGSFYVDRVIYAASEGFGCDLDLNRFNYRLFGNEPFWNLSITDAEGELSRMGAPGQTWSDLRSETTGASIKFRSDESSLGSLEVSIQEEPCRDSMSGAFYGYSASVSVAGEMLSGCALAGSRQ